MKVLICGDRFWSDKETIRARVEKLPKDTVVIHGAARGADSLAAISAKACGLQVQAFPADWGKYGNAAGPIRNRLMLDEKPGLVIAFHRDLENSKGTKDTVGEARRRGISVEVIGDLR